MWLFFFFFLKIQFQPPLFKTEHMTLGGEPNNFTPAHAHRNTYHACHRNKKPLKTWPHQPFKR